MNAPAEACDFVLTKVTTSPLSQKKAARDTFRIDDEVCCGSDSVIRRGRFYVSASAKAE